MLRIHLFGSGEAHNGERCLDSFPNQQSGLLLCYLLLHRGQPQTRERLAAVFWEELPTATARKYLRNAVWRLKCSFEDAGISFETIVQVSGETIGLVNSSNLWLDVAAFDQAAVDTQRSEPGALSAVQVQQIEAAIALYRGDLLEGIYADWTLYDRERLRLLYLSLRQKLMLHHSAFGRFEEAAAHAGHILAVDPVREKIHRQLMRLHALSGDRNAALAQYKRCKQLLREELGLAPMPETRQLYRQIKEDHFDREKAEVTEAAASNAGILQRLHGLKRLANRIQDELRSLEKLINADS